MILGAGDSARLRQRIRAVDPARKQPLGLDAAVPFLVREDPGIFLTIGVYRDDAASDAVEAAMFDEVAKLAKKPPSADEVSRAKQQILASFVFGMDSPEGLAEQVGQAWILTGDPGSLAGELDAMDKVTPADVARVASTYLVPPKATIVVVPPVSAPWRRCCWATLDHVDDRKVEALAGATARAGVFVTPTLAFFRLWFAAPSTDDEVRARPDFGHIPAKMRELYWNARQRYWQNPPSEERRARYIAVRNRMVRAIVDSGGRIMAGSDGPGGLMGYGWTLHRELELLVEAGLTPWQALASATRVPSEYLGAEREWGTITPGTRADLVLLEADPLADIRNTARIAGVSVGGRWLEAAALRRMIAEAGARLQVAER